VLNATLGWDWADPIAGLVIAAVAVKEGREAWRGEACSCVPGLPVADDTDGCGCEEDCTDTCCAGEGTDTRPESIEISAVPKNGW
jgi:hypothetical protein